MQWTSTAAILMLNLGLQKKERAATLLRSSSLVYCYLPPTTDLQPLDSAKTLYHLVPVRFNLAHGCDCWRDNEKALLGISTNRPLSIARARIALRLHCSCLNLLLSLKSPREVQVRPGDWKSR